MHFRKLCLPFFGFLLIGVCCLGQSPSLIIPHGVSLILDQGSMARIPGLLQTPENDSALVLRIGNRNHASLFWEDGHPRARVERLFSPALQISYHTGSPVGSQKLAEGILTPGVQLHAWYEPSQSWVSAANHFVWPQWSVANHSQDHLIPMMGYMMSFQPAASPDTIKIFSGRLNSGPYSTGLFATAHHADPHPGYNLLSNPYAAAIDWYAPEGWSGRDCLLADDKQAYVAWKWSDEARNFAAMDLRSHLKNHNGAGGYIAPMEGFWVQARRDSHGCLLGLDQRVFWQAPAKGHDAVYARPETLRLRLVSDFGHDELILESGHGSASRTPKMMSLCPEAPQIYAWDALGGYSILMESSLEDKYETDIVVLPGSGQNLCLHLNGSLTSTHTLQLHFQSNAPAITLSAYEPWCFGSELVRGGETLRLMVLKK